MTESITTSSSSIDIPETHIVPADFYGDGKFDFISYSDGPYYRNAHWAITETKMWEWMREFTPKVNEGFIFCSHPNITLIFKKMCEEEVAHSHSGASFGITLQQMSYIAKNGYNHFRDSWMHNNENIQETQENEDIPMVEKTYYNNINKNDKIELI